MGACASKQNEDLQGNTRLNDRKHTTNISYQMEPLSNPKQHIGVSHGKVVVGSPPNENYPGYPAQAGAPEIVYQNGDLSQRIIYYNEALSMDCDQRQRMEGLGAPNSENPVHIAERVHALAGDYVTPETVGNNGNKYGNSGGVSANTIHEVGLLSSFNPTDRVYDPVLQGMVYVLDKNQSVDGLRPLTVPVAGAQESIGIKKTGGKHGAEPAVGLKMDYQKWELSNNPECGLVELGPSNHLNKGTDKNVDVTNISNVDYQYEAEVPASHVTLQNRNFTGISDNNLQDASTVTSRVAIQRKVYNPMIGEMIWVLDNNGQGASLEEIANNPNILTLNYQNLTPNGSQRKMQHIGKDTYQEKISADNYILNTYTQLRTLGKGGSCRVLACRKNSSEKKYALKIMSKRDIVNARLFQKERDILQKLQHQNIMYFHEAHVDSQNFYIVSMLYEGGDLFERIFDGLTESRVSYLVRTILHAVKYCHSKNIVHRDLKPENCVFKTRDPNSELVLIDFGCAKEVENNKRYYDVVGTPFYLAPELVLRNNYIRTGRVLKSSDIWSIGVIAYILLTGRPPFKGQSNTEIYKNVILKPLKFPSKVKLSKPFIHFCWLMLKKSPKRRLRIDAALAHIWVQGRIASNYKVSQYVSKLLLQFNQHTKLKKAICSVLAQNMGSKAQNRMREEFNRLDENCDGALDESELSLLLMDMGFAKNHARLEASKIIQSGDFDGSGTIEF